MSGTRGIAAWFCRGWPIAKREHIMIILAQWGSNSHKVDNNHGNEDQKQASQPSSALHTTLPIQRIEMLLMI